MAVYCPRTGHKVIYLTCMDCDIRVCKGEIDPSENKETTNLKKENTECSTTQKEKKKD
jgi:hypothetical protein